MKMPFEKVMNSIINKLFKGRKNQFEIQKANGPEELKICNQSDSRIEINKRLSNLDLRTIVLSRKGIFACPKYIDLFINIDDALMK